MNRTAVLLALAVAAPSPQDLPQRPQQEPPRDPAPANDSLRIAWRDRKLTITGPGLPAAGVAVWYLEAYCRSGSTKRDWRKTVIPHRQRSIDAESDHRVIKLRDEVEGGVEVLHEIRAGRGEVDFRVVATNRGKEFVDAVWVQPCIQVAGFTGRKQETYLDRCFVFVEGELRKLDEIERAEEAIYRGGQVYVPEGIDREDVNPRPLSPHTPSNGLIGCLSADGSTILATAWHPYQELFQGVIVCIHSDFRLGGLQPGETKRARGKIYVVPNDPRALVERYRRDFPEQRGER